MPSRSLVQFAYQHAEQQNTETESKIENTLWQFDAIRTLAYTNEEKKIIENFIVRVVKVMRAIQTVRAHDVGGRCVYDRKFKPSNVWKRVLCSAHQHDTPTPLARAVSTYRMQAITSLCRHNETCKHITNHLEVYSLLRVREYARNTHTHKINIIGSCGLEINWCQNSIHTLNDWIIYNVGNLFRDSTWKKRQKFKSKELAHLNRWGNCMLITTSVIPC